MRLESLRVLDKVLLEEPADTYYKAKRERVAIISLDCAQNHQILASA